MTEAELLHRRLISLTRSPFFSTYQVLSMKTRKIHLLLAALALSLSGTAMAELKAEDAIKYRQSGYAFAAWNIQRIKANVEGNFNKDEVVRAANAIQAIANSGMGALYLPGTDKGKGWEETRLKPELFTSKDLAAQVAGAFIKEADEMARVAARGDAGAVRTQLGKLQDTCKGCHKEFKIKR